MGKLFDKVGEDDMFGAQTWEEAESTLQKEALQIALNKENMKKEELNLLLQEIYWDSRLPVVLVYLLSHTTCRLVWSLFYLWSFYCSRKYGSSGRICR